MADSCLVVVHKQLLLKADLDYRLELSDITCNIGRITPHPEAHRHTVYANVHGDSPVNELFCITHTELLPRPISGARHRSPDAAYTFYGDSS
jgi:hypothetical protein